MTPANAVRAVTWAGCAVGAILALSALGAGVTGSIRVPIGPFGEARLALDAVSALFLLIVCMSGAAAALDCGTLLLPVTVAALALTLIAADGLTLVIAFGVASLASLAWERDVQHGLRSTAASVLCLAGAVALLTPPVPGIGLSFDALRGAPPDGIRAASVALLTLCGAVPRLVWPPRSGPSSATLSGCTAVVAVYVVVRILFDLCGETPGWWGLPLMVLGAAAAVLGGMRANAAGDLLAILAASRMGTAGLAAVGLGVALVARGSDVAPLAALALAGALLQIVSSAVFDTLLALCAGAVLRGAETAALSRLGGLIRSMPTVGLGALVGAACLAGLPLTAGFPGRWLILQSFMAGLRLGGLWLQAGLALVLAALALGTALAAAAAVRLVGIGFLGRPRTPSAAMATDAPRRVRLAIAGLAGCCMLAGFWPSAILATVQPALMQLVGTRLGGGRFVVIAGQADAPGYAAPGIAALVAVGVAVAVYTLRRFANPASRRAPAWDGGRDAAVSGPSYDDPAAQYSAASAGQAVLQSLGYPGRLGMPRWLKAAASLLRRAGRSGRGGALALVLVLSLPLWAAA